MRPSLLLAIGIVFLSLALVSKIYLLISERPEELHSDTVEIGRVPFSGQGQASAPITDTPDPLTSVAELTLTPAPTRTPTPIPTATPSYMIEAEWPARIKAGLSRRLRISLIKTSYGYVAKVELQGSSIVASTPLPAGTPGTEPQSAFGEKYQAYAVAHLAGASFTIIPASSDFQSLDQPRIDWTWSIASDHPGLQGLEASIEIQWKHVENVDIVVKRQIWRSHLDIYVSQSFLSAGQVNAFSLLSAFVGSGLSIPWLYETISKRRARQRRKSKKRI